VVGILFGYAALTFDPQQAQGLAGATRMILHRPVGQFLLTAVALGFFAFGLFAFLRRMQGRSGHRQRGPSCRLRRRGGEPDLLPAPVHHGRLGRRGTRRGLISPHRSAQPTTSDTSPSGYGLSGGRAHQRGSGSLDRGTVGVLHTQPAWGRCRRFPGRDTARTVSPLSRFPRSVTPAGPPCECADTRTQFSPNALLTTSPWRVTRGRAATPPRPACGDPVTTVAAPLPVATQAALRATRRQFGS